MVSIGAPRIISKQKHHKHSHNNQLPSPISPSTQPSPLSPSTSTSPLPAPGKPLPLSDQHSKNGSDCRDNLVPIKGFVHEVLRRSRTSGCVLQTALCYLEAVRPKIPEIARREKAGASQAEKSPERISMATEAELRAELDYDTESNICWDSIINTDNCLDDDAMATVRVHDSDLDDISNPIGSCGSQDHDTGPKAQPLDSKPPSSTMSSPLPSPLLCPRRAFLASLILASKFTQDKCYSNRAWAKLSGLPPREIGRCERALGEALEWRLWVGKPPVAAQTSPPIVKRPVVRCQSESSLVQSASNRTAFLVRNEGSASSAGYPSPSRSVSRGGLRRCATLPAEAFAAPISESTSCDKTMGTIPDTLFDQDDMSDPTPSLTSSITVMPRVFHLFTFNIDVSISSQCRHH
jgi:PHO85 cyclin-5